MLEFGEDDEALGEGFFVVMVNAASPAIFEEGTMLMMLGTGLLTPLTVKNMVYWLYTKNDGHPL